MGNVVRFPGDAPSKFGFERVKSTYSVRDISTQFGLSERHIRQWTRDGLIQTAAAGDGELRYDFRSLHVFRRLRELRGQGLSTRQIEAELHGQLNLFQGGQLIRLPVKATPFEEALLLHERGDARAAEAYRSAIRVRDYTADAYCNLGILEFDGGRMAQAFDSFTQSLREDPRHFESHFNLANLYFDTGDLRLARLHYEFCAEIEPHFANVYFNLGLVHALHGDLSSAVEALGRYKDLVPPEDTSHVDDLLASLHRVIADRR